MLIIKTDQPNYMVVTVSQNSELTNPEYLFSFVHIFSKERVSFIPVDVSTHKSRYDEFYFVEGAGPGEINFPYSGQYLYTISEQPAGSGNLDPALATNVVENGEAQIIVQSAITQDSQYDIFISNDEFDSNIIFAPGEPNPTPNITPSITPSPTPTGNPVSPTPTPSITPTITQTPSHTPTLTPTPSSTPPSNSPLALGALWWVDFTDAATLTISSGNVQVALDKINNVPFSAATGGPSYNPTGYLGVSGSVLTNATQLRNASSTYSGITEYTWFGRVYDDVVSQRGGKIFYITDVLPYPAGGTYSYISDFNFNPYPPGPVWYFLAETTNGSASFDGDFTYSAWTNIALRFYSSGGKSRFELWENGSETQHIEVSSSSPLLVPNPIFNLMWDGGIDFNTEQFFFGRKLTNGEMNQMFTYLNDKY